MGSCLPALHGPKTQRHGQVKPSLPGGAATAAHPREAKGHRRSLNSEIVERLYRSLQGAGDDQIELIAQALLRDLNPDVLVKMYESMKRATSRTNWQILSASLS